MSYMQIPNEPIISIKELNKIIHFIGEQDVKHLNVKFTNSIKKIDIAFIAGLILCNKEYNITFSIDYNGEISEKDEEGKIKHRIFEIRNYLKQFEKLFDTDWHSVFVDFNRINELSDNDFIVSKSFAPIIFVRDKSTIDAFFEKIDKEILGESLYLYKKDCIENIGKSATKTEAIYLESELSIKKN